MCPVDGTFQLLAWLLNEWIKISITPKGCKCWEQLTLKSLTNCLKSLWTKRLSYFYYLDFKAATPSLKSEVWKKSSVCTCWKRYFIAWSLNLERWQQTKLQGAKRHLQRQYRVVFLRAQVLQFLNVCKITLFVLCALYYTVQLLRYSNRNKKQFTNKLLFAMGFSSDHRWALFLFIWYFKSGWLSHFVGASCVPAGAICPLQP